jgi:protein O-GlcNAc transferase
MADRALAERIRTDEIDLLMDLSGHTARNRLGAFALTLAPVLATWGGLIGATGLPATDRRIMHRPSRNCRLSETAM